MRKLQKGGMVQEDIIYGREGRTVGGIVHKEDSKKKGEGIVQEDITEGRDSAEGGHYKREG